MPNIVYFFRPNTVPTGVDVVDALRRKLVTTRPLPQTRPTNQATQSAHISLLTGSCLPALVPICGTTEGYLLLDACYFGGAAACLSPRIKFSPAPPSLGCL